MFTENLAVKSELEKTAELLEQQRLHYFSEIQKSMQFYSDEEYQKVYANCKLFYGINSPAFVNTRKKMIAINKESVPDQDFLDFFVEHECWEAYLADNWHEYYLVDAEIFYAGQDAQKEKFLKMPLVQRKRPAHCYATLKEFEVAKKAGKLDQYMAWWRDFYQRDLDNIAQLPEDEIIRISKYYKVVDNHQEAILQFIRQNRQIKEDVYKKLKAK
jgi:hypothetical protein